MKVTWEEDDIRVGRRYGRIGIKEVWMIGYLAPGGKKAGVVSVSLADGMVTPPRSKAELAEDLTQGEYLPIELIPGR